MDQNCCSKKRAIFPAELPFLKHCQSFWIMSKSFFAVHEWIQQNSVTIQIILEVSLLWVVSFSQGAWGPITIVRAELWPWSKSCSTFWGFLQIFLKVPPPPTLTGENFHLSQNDTGHGMLFVTIFYDFKKYPFKLYDIYYSTKLYISVIFYNLQICVSLVTMDHFCPTHPGRLYLFSHLYRISKTNSCQRYATAFSPPWAVFSTHMATASLYVRLSLGAALKWRYFSCCRCKGMFTLCSFLGFCFKRKL